MERIRNITIDIMGLARLAIIIICLLSSKGSVLFWFALYLLLKEVKFHIKWGV